VPIDLDNHDSNYAYREFSIPEDRKIIVSTGRASYYKGIDFFIECANELVNNQGYRNLHFLFCGDGPDLGDFQRQINNMHVKNYFTFTGKRSDIREILPSCHIGFHAAKGEVGYSLSILEYMSAGLVTVVPDGPSTSLATTNMENGILYKPRNLASATDAIRLALDPHLADHISKKGILSVKNDYNIQNTNRHLIKSLENIFLR
jgi:glycosyltransferase involved in cell wall biosynthesis